MPTSERSTKRKGKCEREIFEKTKIKKKNKKTKQNETKTNKHKKKKKKKRRNPVRRQRLKNGSIVHLYMYLPIRLFKKKKVKKI